VRREIGQDLEALKIVTTALEDDADNRAFFKLWLIKAQLLENTGQIAEARDAYDEALKIDQCKKLHVVWL